MMRSRTWQDVAAEAQQYRDDSIRRVEPDVPRVPAQLPLDVTGIPRQVLTEEEIEITELLPEELLPRLARGQVSAEKVARAFLRRAGVAQALVNCITELLPEAAVARAKFLDKYLRDHGKTIGPLHGLPISVKEHIGFKGLGLNTGFVSWWDHKGKEDALSLQILSKAGGVFFARTSEPQALMHLETSNNLYGVTVNPFNRALTCGGSSGGEGALIGLRGSCLGVGTDIGGSVRNPAANCGLYGLKPSSYRIPEDGCDSTKMGSEQIVSVVGPLSTSLDGLKMFMKTVIDAEPWRKEPSLIPLPWRENHSYFAGKDLNIAVMWHDNVVQPHPPIRRALRTLVKGLNDLGGIQVVDWKPYKHAYAWELISGLYFCDGGAEEIAAMEASGEPQRPLTRFIIGDNPFVKHRSIEETWELTEQRDSYRTEYAKIWDDTDVDVILCPAGPGAAPPLNKARYWNYTSQWNLLDYSALVFPVTRVDPEIDVPNEDFKPLSEKDQENHELYRDPQVYAGAPVSLQLVGRRYEEEKVLQAFEIIRKKLHEVGSSLADLPTLQDHIKPKI